MKYLYFFISLLMIQFATAQESLIPNEDFTVQVSKGKKLGVTPRVSQLLEKDITDSEKRAANKLLKAAPDNFKGRRGESNAVRLELEHQGEDKLWQKGFDNRYLKSSSEPIVNIDGISSTFGSPNDPSGDVSDKFYVQAINATEIGVYELDGTLMSRFAANTLWAQFNVQSEGDPIILYDEQSDKWIVTEFTDPANLLIGITQTNDPLGSYDVYNFPTPIFPDYPKYALSPEALVLTTNEGGPGQLHQYFFDLAALMAGADEVAMQRIAVSGNLGTESGFFVTTPVDWNGTNLPYDNNPITMRINDSSFAGGPAQDQIELYTFDVDFEDANNTSIVQTSIIVSPFDSYPCSTNVGGPFACIQQLNGGGIEGLPEVIMNIPHLRNFGTHESLVFNFVTDVTDGENLAGIRWIEFRRTLGSRWSLYQEGTFAPDDGLNRFMGAIAMDANGHIGLGYNVSSEDSFIGLRYTGRLSTDPLGEMSVQEVTVVDGVTNISSNSRLGDYSQMSVAPNGDNTFWFTGEYAGNANARNSLTRIFSFKLTQDTFDLAVSNIVSPTTSANLTDQEELTIEVANLGLNTINEYNISIEVDGQIIQSTMIQDSIVSGEIVAHTFDNTADMSEFRTYNVVATVTAVEDRNPNNDTRVAVVQNLRQVDAEIDANVLVQDCQNDEIVTEIIIDNQGADIINNLGIEVVVNGEVIDTFQRSIVIQSLGEATIPYNVAVDSNFRDGSNDLSFNLINVNNNGQDLNQMNDMVSVDVDYDIDIAPVSLIINTDRFAQENSWEFREEGSMTIIASAQLERTDRDDQVTFPLCVSPDKCYVLTVFDSYGDGICCAAGNGNFSVVDQVGNVFVMNNGNFSFSAEENFCADMVGCTLTAITDVTNASTADDNDGMIMITASSGDGNYIYSIDDGITFVESNVFDNLPPGDYPVVVTDGEGRCVYEELVTVNFSTSITELSEHNLIIKPNPTDGVIQVLLPSQNSNQSFIEFQVLNMKGQILQARKIGIFDNVYTGTISLYNYPNGQYILRYISDEFSGMARVVKGN